jgi:predicted N-acyltransferase
VRIDLVNDLGTVEPAAWDALAGDDDPFVEHAFLYALEESRSVGGRSGWEPCHVVVYDDERLVGALPLYGKHHSFGEYIFDWGWADAAARIGVRYYPKLVSMVPFTPATGRRLLVHPGVERARVVAALVEGAIAAVEELGASSLHLNFLAEAERDEVLAHPRLVARVTQQFHFHNRGYETFDAFLAALRAPARKQIKRERRRVRESGLAIRVVRGTELEPAEWDALRRFYEDTCAKKGAFPYLTKRFFALLAKQCPERVVAALAYDGSVPVAGTLNFEKGNVLYGRYWGCDAAYDMLHFELCYYQLIERTIERGLTRFEAGAQGMHKLKRGLMPSPIHSTHFIAHPALAAAIADYLPREALAVEEDIDELAERGPFRRDDEPEGC